jgi:MFS family permease
MRAAAHSLQLKHPPDPRDIVLKRQPHRQRQRAKDACNTSSAAERSGPMALIERREPGRSRRRSDEPGSGRKRRCEATSGLRPAQGMKDMNTRTATLDSRTAWVVAAAALGILTVAHGAPLLSAVALKPIAADLHTARSGPSGAGSLAYVGAAVGGIAAGWLSSWVAIRWIVAFGAIMIAAGLVVSASGGLPALYVGHGVLIGLFGASCMFSPLVTYVSRWFERRRGAAVALISAGQPVAGAVWPILFQAGIDHLGWRQTMVLFGGLAATSITVLAVAFLQAPPELPPAARAAGSRAGPAAAVLGLPPNMVMALLMVAI